MHGFIRDSGWISNPPQSKLWRNSEFRLLRVKDTSFDPSISSFSCSCLCCCIRLVTSALLSVLILFGCGCFILGFVDARVSSRLDMIHLSLSPARFGLVSPLTDMDRTLTARFSLSGSSPHAIYFTANYFSTPPKLSWIFKPSFPLIQPLFLILFLFSSLIFSGFFYFHFFIPRTIRLNNQPSLHTIAPSYTFVTSSFLATVH
jgi:hypothetical protein